jgi:YD repeat-containing protein
VTKPGPTVTYEKDYTYDRAGRRMSVKDVKNGGWEARMSYDGSGRMTRIVVTAGSGANPFPWPRGTTNVTCDGNGNVTQLWGEMCRTARSGRSRTSLIMSRG